MGKVIKIYLAGKIPKGDEIGVVTDWRKDLEEELLRSGEYEFLSPEDTSLDESRPREVFGHDCYLVRRCDVLLVNAPEKLGVGTAQEMVIAKYLGKYVYTILPKGTHHRRVDLRMHERIVPDWIHPFIFAMSDRIFESAREAGEFFAHHREGMLRLRKKSLREIDEAIDEYIRSRRER